MSCALKLCKYKLNQWVKVYKQPYIPGGKNRFRFYKVIEENSFPKRTDGTCGCSRRVVSKVDLIREKNDPKTMTSHKVRKVVDEIYLATEKKREKFDASSVVPVECGDKLNAEIESKRAERRKRLMDRAQCREERPLKGSFFREE